MCQSAHLVRPITADRRKLYSYKSAVNQRLRNLAVFVILFALLLKVKSKDISNVKKIANEGRNIRIRNENVVANKIDSNYEEDDGEFHAGHSAYLHSSSSMLAADYGNYTGDRVLPGGDNATLESPEVAAKGHQRTKRGVTHLYNMIVCATGCNPLSYKGYGCYCGFLGSGYPMDGIDRCCKIHDWCYDATDCPMFVEYFVPYYWKCYHGYKPICAIEHGEWGSSGSCAQRLCECDRMFAECLRRYSCPRHKAVCTSSPWRLIQNIFMII